MNMLTTGDCFRIVRTDFANLPSVVLHGNWGVSSDMMTHPSVFLISSRLYRRTAGITGCDGYPMSPPCTS